MPKTLKVISIVIFFISLSPLAFSQAQTTDSIRFVTYYPSPYGSYAELRTKKLAVGAGYINAGTLAWNTGGPCMLDEICNADLVVEGNVGIGTYRPQGKLSVSFHGEDDQLAVYSPADNLLAIQVLIDGKDLAGYPPNQNIANNTNLLLQPLAGNVGIGTTNLYGGFHIKKSGQALNLQTENVEDTFDIQFYDADDLSGVFKWNLTYRSNNDPGDGSGPNALKLLNHGLGGTVMTWRYDGNVGIGTPSPQTPAPGPGGTPATGNLDVNDVYLRSAAKWASQAAGSSFGTRTDNLLKNQVYRADTDGFIVAQAYDFGSDIGGILRVLVDNNNPPVTVRGKAADNGGDHGRDTLTIPVKKGEYWQVIITNNTNDYSIYWMPFGS